MESPVESSHTTNSHDSEDDIEKSTHIRFLVSNGAAGSVIGRGGSTITKFQSHSGARIQLSRNNEFFPGTTDRIIMISGAIDEITKGMELILAKLSSEVLVEDGSDADPTPKLRLIVPNTSCGGIIGKGGATIKYFTDVSGARINISPQDYSCGITDRLVTITGSLEEQIHAVSLILWKLAEDSHYLQSLNAAFTYAGVVSYPPYGGYIARPVRPSAYNGSNGDRGKFQNVKVGYQDDRSNSVTFGVPDEHIGLVVGRGGRNIMEISQASGARIKISDRGDFMSGTSNRKVTITGSKAAIHTAKDMIMQKVAYASEG